MASNTASLLRQPMNLLNASKILICLTYSLLVKFLEKIMLLPITLMSTNYRRLMQNFTRYVLLIITYLAHRIHQPETMKPEFSRNSNQIFVGYLLSVFLTKTTRLVKNLFEFNIPNFGISCYFR